MQALYVDVNAKQRVGFMASDTEGAVILRALCAKTFGQIVISGVRDDQSPFFLCGSGYAEDTKAELEALFPTATPEPIEPTNIFPVDMDAPAEPKLPEEE